MNISFFEKTRSQDVFWSDFDRFGRPRGSKGEAKRDPRGTKNETKMTSKFGSIFGSILDRTWGAQEIKSELWGGLRGAWLDSLSSKNSKKISITIQTRSDPSGGGG